MDGVTQLDFGSHVDVQGSFSQYADTGREVGDGTYGAVKVYELKTGCTAQGLPLRIAVKIPKSTSTAADTAALLEKINNLKDLHHANVVKVYGACIKDGKVVTLMEYCPGPTLRDILKDTTPSEVSWREMLVFIVQILLGLEYLHEEKIIHSDIKPANIVVAETREGNKLFRTVKLVDIDGLIRLEGDTTRTGDAMGICGTQAYWSPEVALYHTGEPEVKVGRKSDIWSTGVVLHEMAFPAERLYSNHHIKRCGQTGGHHQDHGPPCACLEKFFRSALAVAPDERMSATELLRLELFKGVVTYKDVLEQRPPRFGISGSECLSNILYLRYSYLSMWTVVGTDEALYTRVCSSYNVEHYKGIKAKSLLENNAVNTIKLSHCDRPVWWCYWMKNRTLPSLQTCLGLSDIIVEMKFYEVTDFDASIFLGKIFPSLCLIGIRQCSRVKISRDDLALLSNLRILSIKSSTLEQMEKNFLEKLGSLVHFSLDLRGVTCTHREKRSNDFTWLGDYLEEQSELVAFKDEIPSFRYKDQRMYYKHAHDHIRVIQTLRTSCAQCIRSGSSFRIDVAKQFSDKVSPPTSARTVLGPTAQDETKSPYEAWPEEKEWGDPCAACVDGTCDTSSPHKRGTRTIVQPGPVTDIPEPTSDQTQ